MTGAADDVQTGERVESPHHSAVSSGDGRDPKHDPPPSTKKDGSAGPGDQANEDGEESFPQVIPRRTIRSGKSQRLVLNDGVRPQYVHTERPGLTGPGVFKGGRQRQPSGPTS